MKIKSSLLPIAFGLFAISDASADSYFQPHIGYEVKSFTFDAGDAGGDGTTTGLAFGFSIINTNGLYFDLSLSTGEGEVTGFYPEDDYAERIDVTISLGYSLGNGLTVFGGFAETDTQVENQKNQANQPVDFQIISSGLFAGLAKSFSINKTTSVTASFAAGQMTGEFESADPTLDQFDGEGDSIGYSGSLSVTKRFDKISLTGGYKSQAYTYSNMKAYRDDVGDLPDSSESSNSFYVKTSYRF